VLFILCGLCWLLFGIGSGFFLLAYFAAGLGWSASDWFGQFFMPSLSLEINLIWFIHLVGLLLITAFCFLVGVGLCSYGYALQAENHPKKNEGTADQLSVS
jgi:hypothetical protein